MVEEIKAALDSNENLTLEVKDNIMELVTIFHEIFKDVDLTTLKDRLKTLQIKR